MKKRFLAGIGFFYLLVTTCACSKSPGSYFPLTEGRTWKYHMSYPGRFGEIEETTVIVVNFAPREIKGKKVTPQKREAQKVNGLETVFTYYGEDEDGVFIMGVQQPPLTEPVFWDRPNYLLKKPLRVGSTWSEPGSKGGYTIESMNEVVDVSAGTFSRCMKIREDLGEGRTDYVWFAPSVGVIKYSGSGTSYQLEAFTK